MCKMKKKKDKKGVLGNLGKVRMCCLRNVQNKSGEVQGIRPREFMPECQGWGGLPVPEILWECIQISMLQGRYESCQEDSQHFQVSELSLDSSNLSCFHSKLQACRGVGTPSQFCTSGNRSGDLPQF